jgi:hypothetical protein
LIKEKSVAELNVMEKDINTTYSAQSFKMDMGYFDKVLRRIRFHRALKSLENFYREFDEKQDKKIVFNESKEITEYQKDDQIAVSHHQDGDLSPRLMPLSSDLAEQSATQ